MGSERRRSAMGSFLTAGIALAGYAGVRAILGDLPGADAGFFNWTGPTAVDVDIGSAQIDLPIRYYREDSFMAVFDADYDAVRAALPSGDLYPVTMPNGRATIIVFAFNYIKTSVDPYGEIGVVIPCTHGRSAPPLLPLALESRYPGWGGFVLHLPVTTRAARDGGRVIWGLPKFIADMSFERRPAYQRVRMMEEEAHILTLTVQQQGATVKDNRPLVIYSVLDGQLLRTNVPSRAVYQLGMRPGLGVLELGDHPVADQLRAMDVSSMAVLTKNYLTRFGILPAGEVVGPADRAYSGYPGKDRDFGQLAIRYDDVSEPVNVHRIDVAA